jgi:hypothetical protein
MDKKAKELNKEMKRSWLIQRLKAPFHNDNSPLVQISRRMAFGGGLVNGGLSQQAMGILGKVFDFDYMGSSEFEWGAVPAALAKIVDHIDQYKWYSEVVGYRYQDWKTGKVSGGKETIYILCPPEWKEEVGERISNWAIDKEEQLKKSTYLAASLSGKADFVRRIKGWLELDNGFMFFSDQMIFDKMMRLLGKD